MRTFAAVAEANMQTQVMSKKEKEKMLKTQQQALQQVIQNIKEDKKKLGDGRKKVNKDKGLLGLGRRVTAEWKVIICISSVSAVSLSLRLLQRQLDTISHLLRSEVTRN
jgi:Flp pilus assembly protein TadB